MRCSEFTVKLDAYLDGELSPQEVASFEEHASSCPDCLIELEETRELLRTTASLDRSVPPARDLWPDISERLQPPRGDVVEGRFGRRLGPWAAVAAMALVAIGSVVVSYMMGRQHAQTVVVQQQTTPLAVPARVEESSAAAVEAEFLEARNELIAALEQRRGTLSPETLEVVHENMRVIDGAIDRITDALDDDPGNLLLASQLTTAYQRQIELLRRANKLPAEI
jgi:anti-sigma factor RsiW